MLRQIDQRQSHRRNRRKQGPFDICCKASWASESLCDFRKSNVYIKLNIWRIFSQGFFGNSPEFAEDRWVTSDPTIQNSCRHRTALKVGSPLRVLRCWAYSNDVMSFDFGVKLLCTSLIYISYIYIGLCDVHLPVPWSADSHIGEGEENGWKWSWVPRRTAAKKRRSMEFGMMEWNQFE